MRAEIHLALRYLIGLRRRTHVATVTLISLVGLALGVIALVVTLALLEGFQDTVRERVISSSAHARVRPPTGRVLDDPEAVVARVREAVPHAEVSTVVRGICLVSATYDAVPATVEGRADVDVTTVDRVVAARLVVGAGDRLRLVSPRSRLTPMGPLPIRLEVEISAVELGSRNEEQGLVRVPIALAQKLLYGEPVVEAVEVRDVEDPWGVARTVRRALSVDAEAGGAAVEPVVVDGFEELHRSLFLALFLERAMIFVAVSLMLVVAALNLLCNVAMLAAEKRRDLAVLAGLGLSPRRIRRLFLCIGTGIGLAGAVVGTVIGVGLARFLDATGLLRLERGVFSVSSVPFSVEPGTVLIVGVMALALAAGASYLPARAVARRQPVEGFRYE